MAGSSPTASSTSGATVSGKLLVTRALAADRTSAGSARSAASSAGSKWPTTLRPAGPRRRPELRDQPGQILLRLPPRQLAGSGGGHPAERQQDQQRLVR